jgi:osmotically-inducible protein OsmY
MRYLFDVDWPDPALYDVVLNTEKLSFEAGAELVLELLRRAEFAGTDTSRQVVRDRALASRVRVALLADLETRKYRTAVEAESGVIQLEGTAALEKAAAVTRTVPGVVEVKVQTLDVPSIPPFVV